MQSSRVGGTRCQTQPALSKTRAVATGKSSPSVGAPTQRQVALSRILLANVSGHDNTWCALKQRAQVIVLHTLRELSERDAELARPDAASSREAFAKASLQQLGERRRQL
jgi:hypothetical protein